MIPSFWPPSHISVSIVLLAYSFALGAQNESELLPGGVHSPVFWFTYHDDSTNFLDDLSNRRYSHIAESRSNLVKHTINFHPTIELLRNSEDPVTDTIHLHNTLLPQASYFGAFYPKYEEVTLYSDDFYAVRSNGVDIFRFTSEGIYKMGQKLFLGHPFQLNTQKELTESMKVLSYLSADMPIQESVWGMERETDLVFDFSGYIPEFIIYNRYLTDLERRKVESYLGLKYGLTMDDDFIDGKGQIIWDKEKMSDYDYRVIAIGKDSNLGFDQYRANSTYDERYSYNHNSAATNRSITIQFKEASMDQVEDGHYIFCGEYLSPHTTQNHTTLNQILLRNGITPSRQFWILQNEHLLRDSVQVIAGGDLRDDLTENFPISAKGDTLFLIIRSNDTTLSEGDFVKFEGDTSQPFVFDISHQEFTIGVTGKLILRRHYCYNTNSIIRPRPDNLETRKYGRLQKKGSSPKNKKVFGFSYRIAKSTEGINLVNEKNCSEKFQKWQLDSNDLEMYFSGGVGPYSVFVNDTLNTKLNSEDLIDLDGKYSVVLKNIITPGRDTKIVIKDLSGQEESIIIPKH